MTYGPWVDMGRLVIAYNGTILLVGECFVLPAASFMTGGLGRVNVMGLIHIGGLTLPQDNSTGSWHLLPRGTISGGDAGGVIATADGQVLYGEGGTLENVVVNGALTGSLTLDHVTINGTYDSTTAGASPGGLTLLSDLTLDGQVILDNSQLLAVGTASIGGKGTIRLDDGALKISDDSASTLTIGPDILVHGTSFDILFDSAQALVNQGTIRGDSAGGKINFGHVISGPSADGSWVNQGAVTWSAGAIVVSRASLLNSGVITPGGSSATSFTITDDFTQDASGSLDIDLVALPAGAFANDFLAVNGSVSLDGTLNVTYHGNAPPPVGQDFRIIGIGAAAVITGDFATKNGIDGPGPSFATAIDGTGYHLTTGQRPAILAFTPIIPNPRNTSVSSIVVTFTAAIDPTTFDSHDVSLMVNGGPVVLPSGVTVSLVSGSTYRIGGLAGLTSTEGRYALTVDTHGIRDPAGQSGTTTGSISWLMDTTSPASQVSKLPAQGTNLSIPVSVTGFDPGATPSGVSSFDIYGRSGGGPWKLWTTVPAASPTATFAGQSNTIYSFYSLARDLAGNVEKKMPAIEASTYLPDLTPPVTAINGTGGSRPSLVDPARGAFTLNLTGSDSGSSGLAFFRVFVAIDAQPPVPAGPAIPAGTPDGVGRYHMALAYQGLTDGVQHQYRFFSTAIDGAGNVEATHAASADVIFTVTFAPPPVLQVTGLSVARSAAERSYIRYLGIAFKESDAQSGGQLGQIAGSVGSASPRIRLFKYDLDGTPASRTPVPLQAPTTVAIIDHLIELDFGAGGIGGTAGTIAADGDYELDIDLPDGQTAVHHFYRLLGDVTGDGVVDNLDLTAIAASLGRSSPSGMAALSVDVNGDGSVTALDLTLATRSKGRKVKTGLPLG